MRTVTKSPPPVEVSGGRAQEGTRRGGGWEGWPKARRRRAREGLGEVESSEGSKGSEGREARGWRWWAREGSGGLTRDGVSEGSEGRAAEPGSEGSGGSGGSEGSEGSEGLEGWRAPVGLGGVWRARKLEPSEPSEPSKSSDGVLGGVGGELPSRGRGTRGAEEHKPRLRFLSFCDPSRRALPTPLEPSRHETPPLSDRPSESTRRPGSGVSPVEPSRRRSDGTPPALWAGEPSDRRSGSGRARGQIHSRSGRVEGCRVEGVEGWLSPLALPISPTPPAVLGLADPLCKRGSRTISRTQ